MNQQQPSDAASKAAQELSKLGARKGGRARASVLSLQERQEIARRAARARWGGAEETEPAAASDDPGVSPRRARLSKTSPGAESLPYSMFRGNLEIGDMELEGHVLSDGRRVLTQREVVRALSGGRESGNLNRYLDRNPMFNRSLESEIVHFRVPGSNVIAAGYEATLLIEICEAYLDARYAEKLKPSQSKLARQAEIIIRACAKVGIIALIDEATGYQEVRAKQALQIKLQAFIADDMQEWARMFPQEFFFELARLEGVRYSPRLRPIRWGKYIMAFVYDAIDEDVGKELRERNPNPHYMKNHHQWLTDFAKGKVHDQIERVIAIMKLCDDMEDFRRSFSKVFQKTPVQMTFDELWSL